MQQAALSLDARQLVPCLTIPSERPRPNGLFCSFRCRDLSGSPLLKSPGPPARCQAHVSTIGVTPAAVNCGRTDTPKLSRRRVQHSSHSRSKPERIRHVERSWFAITRRDFRVLCSGQGDVVHQAGRLDNAGPRDGKRDGNLGWRSLSVQEGLLAVALKDGFTG